MIINLQNKSKERGQGLLEYGMLMVLIAIMMVVILTFLGGGVQNLYCQIVNQFDDLSGECQPLEEGNQPEAPEEEPEEEPTSSPYVIAITKADYNSKKNELHIDATVNGGTDSDVILTVSSGGVMETKGGKNSHYHLKFKLNDCPCEITVTSNFGDTDFVTVGP